MRRQGDAAEDLQQGCFPAPLRPMIPILSPWRTLKLMSARPNADGRTASNAEDRLLELIIAPHIELERLANAIAADDEIR